MVDAQSSAAEQFQALESGSETATSLLAKHDDTIKLAREKVNALKPLDLKPSDQAAESDARRLADKAGPLEGLTLSIKDNIALSGFPTSGGTPSLEDYCPAQGLAVSRLLEAGAICVAKTKLHELAFGITGANAHDGDVLNPFDTTRLAGGSSSGAAAAVALGASAIAIGTDTGGSCRIPAAHCGVVGFRPSLYRYPIDGYLRLSPSRDTLGLLARCVADIELADQVIAPELASQPIPSDRPIKLGIVRSFLMDTVVAEAFEAALAKLTEAGVAFAEVDLTEAAQIDEACGLTIAVFETALSISRLAEGARGQELGPFAATIKSADVREMIASQAGADAIPAHAYAEAVAMHLPALRVAFARAFEGVDALIYPTTGLQAPRLDQVEMVELGGQPIPTFPAYTMATRPDSMAGVPSISLPCSGSNGLPVGIQLVAPRGHDTSLLALAKVIEPLIGPRPIPRLASDPVGPKG